MATTFFSWQDTYSVNIKEIDNQHKAIIDMLNDLYDAFLNKEHSQKTGEILDRLTDYANYHFHTEEEYFEMFKYAKRSSHMHEHKIFIEKVKAFREEFNQNPTALTYKIINFLREWLVNHIEISDKEYVSCFKGNGLS
jgi:hemerythrin